MRWCRGGQYTRNYKNCNINHTVINQIKPVQLVGGYRVGLNKRKNKNSNVNHTASNPNKSIRNNIKIGYHNARSVCNKTTDIQLFINYRNLDVLTITETWLPPKEKNQVILNELTPGGYKIAHVIRGSRKGEGVAVVYKSILKGCNQTIKTFGTFKCIQILLKCSTDTIRICTIYRSPSRSSSNSRSSVVEFLSEFQNYMNNLSTSSGKLIVVGDFNISLDIKLLKDIHNFEHVLDGLNLEQHVTSQTHNHGHILGCCNRKKWERYSIRSFTSSSSVFWPLSNNIHYKELYANTSKERSSHIEN